MALRVLVVDDSALFRRMISDILSGLPDVEVVGTAPNGAVALERVRALQPDAMTLDVEMPEMDGLATLTALRDAGLLPDVIMVSSTTRMGSEMTLAALQRGAFDFVTKPSGFDLAANKQALADALAPRLRTLQQRKVLRSRRPAVAAAPVAQRPAPALKRPPRLVVIGVSTGGPVALGKLLPLLPATLGVPILIVQHMPPIFTQSLADTLNRQCALTVKEAADGEPLQPNIVYIAPGGRQMGVRLLPDSRPGIALTDDPPEHSCRHAVDYLFRTVADSLPGRAVGVVLTGMGSDGTRGLTQLKAQGCLTIAQDEATSTVYGMPRAAVEAGVVDLVLPLLSIADHLVAALGGRTG